ncbi:MAG: AAA family ATPase [Geobacter sp.]|nr:MAG: AAA family ATPase [Geobacter sp.]
MHIAHIDIRNFRKLKCCRVELSKKETVFVGANNSGKTSAMDALMMFLKRTKAKDISTTDFTLSNWASINKIGEQWASNVDKDSLDLTRSLWVPWMPMIDVWLQVEETEVHYVSHIIPTLDWSGGLLGVRLILEPKKVEDLYKGYVAAYTSAKNTIDLWDSENGDGKKSSLSLWPQSMHDFLDRELHKYFEVRAYVLDPAKLIGSEPQTLPLDSEPLEGDPFAGLFKIDIINAQRGFSDASTIGGASSDRRLSAQLRQYFDKHLDPTELPEANDLDALEAIEAARTAFDEKLKTSFHPAISELEGLNYPGFSDPQIVLSSKLNPLEALNHDTAVQFNVLGDGNPSNGTLYLPEKYNGLGFQNLISMIFKLIRYRDEWMRVGKAAKKEGDADFIAPLHIVLIEEPEAHLHAQVQQVFIKKAYGVLRKHTTLGHNKQFTTQMVVSTHSSHIAHEIDFTSLRYFQRKPAASTNDVPCATVANLTKTFGSDSDTSKFATRYLKTTHCDLFFADAAILVEGPAERMLIPHFIRNKFPDLDKSYISLLEIGGSHAHRLKPLIESLGLLTLIITDLDSVNEKNEKVVPKAGEKYVTGNDTLKTWAPCMTNLDELMCINDVNKISSDGDVRVAYQCKVLVQFGKDKKESAIPYTFEDALVLSNIDFFKKQTSATGLIKKMATAVGKPTLGEACEAMFNALGNGKKAEMALTLLYSTEPSLLQPPKYIHEGLEWLTARLKEKSADIVVAGAAGGGAS